MNGLHVVGGVYREIAIFPPKDVIFGSGGRAARAIQELDPDVELSFFRSREKADASAVNYHVETAWGFKSHPVDAKEMVRFTYYHGLSTPVIRPSRLPFEPVQSIDVQADHVLQFGMLEGDARVTARRVVYDPQNPEAPRSFFDGGSDADDVAYVINCNEIRRLTGEDNIERAASSLLKDSRVKVVVVKCGPDGARVFDRDNHNTIPAFETPHVWPIGSGDVFAAVFAHFWLSENEGATKSALMASRAAATYCDTQELPISRDSIETDFKYPELKPKRKPEDAEIYLAGPFFTMGQLWLVEEAKAALLSAGFSVFSPYHAVGRGEAHEVVPEDIRGIERSNSMLALCDGLDSGTIFETGYAVKAGVPVVAFGEQTSSESMKMMKGTGCKIYRDFTSAVYHAQWEALK